MVVRETSGIKTQRSSRETRRSLRMVSSTFATVSLEVDGLPFVLLSWISVWRNTNSRHHFRMIFLTMHDSPYTSVNSWWISIGVLPFAFKNRKTARTSHFAVVLSGTSITKGCQANTKRPISVRTLGWSGRSDTRNSVANSRTKSSTALWRLTFGIALVYTKFQWFKSYIRGVIRVWKFPHVNQKEKKLISQFS